MSKTKGGFHRVFVYGTLMHGERNADVLQGSPLICEAALTARRKYFMLQFQSVSNPGNFSPGVFMVAEEF